MGELVGLSTAGAHTPRSTHRHHSTRLPVPAGIQICSADFLKGEQTGHGGATYGACAGVCLETQKYPDTPNHPGWPSAAVRKGAPLVSTTIYALSASAVSTEGRG